MNAQKRFTKLLPTVKNVAHKVRFIFEGQYGYLMLFAVFLFVYILSIPKELLALDSSLQHNILYAKTLLSGNLAFEQDPGIIDVAYFNDKSYFTFPPLPSVILIPFAYIFGTGGSLYPINAILFAGTGVIMYHLFKSTLRQKSTTSLFLTVIFLFGTNLWWSALRVSVWYEQHLFALLFTVLFLVEGFGKKRPVILGLLVSAMLLCRYNLVLYVPLGIYFLFKKKHRSYALTIFLLILCCTGIILATYNHVRFGNIFELGYQYIAYDATLTERIEAFGMYSPSYFLNNLYTVLLATPVFQPRFPYLIPSPFGMSLVLTTPGLILLFLKKIPKKYAPIIVTIGLLLASQLFYYNNGWYQFGYRFSLDFLPLLFLLLVPIVKENISRTMLFLGILSILINLYAIITVP